MQQLSDAERRYISKSLKAYLQDSETTLRQASARTGVDFSQISRYLNGRFKRLSPNLRKVCKFANLDPRGGTRKDPAKSKVLIGALRRVWDGSDQHAQAIASTISTLGKYTT